MCLHLRQQSEDLKTQYVDAMLSEAVLNSTRTSSSSPSSSASWIGDVKQAMQTRNAGSRNVRIVQPVEMAEGHEVDHHMKAL